MVALALLVAFVAVFRGPWFVRRIRHRDGDVQRHWVTAGPWEITGLAVLFALFVLL
jgi:hypothetical protein